MMEKITAHVTNIKSDFSYEKAYTQPPRQGQHLLLDEASIFMTVLLTPEQLSRIRTDKPITITQE